MLFRMLFSLLKNLRWVISLVLLAGTLYLLSTQYHQMKASPIGQILPSLAIPNLQETITKLSQTQIAPSESVVPPPDIANNAKKSITIETERTSVTYSIEVADTEEKRALGLMYRTTLPEYAGMYFTFPMDVQYGFWMKNCEISLDIIFIDGQEKIVDIIENAPPCKTLDPEQKSCPSYQPKSPYRAVLEVNAGSAKRNALKIGNAVTIGE